MKRRIFSLLLVLFILTNLVACGAKKEQKQEYKTISELMLAVNDANKISISLEEKFSFDKKIDGHHWNMQGGDTDGKYGYYAMNDGESNGESLTRIYKIDFSTWEIVSISEPIPCGHANDVTYVADTNELVVTWCETPIENATIINAETLEYVSTVSFPYQHAVMDYSPERKQYVMGGIGKKDYTVCDENWEFVSAIPQNKLNFAMQSLECDDKLVYNIQSPNSGGDEGYLFVYTWEGEFLHLITFDMEYESENICIYGNKMILAVNDHHDQKQIRFYEMTFSINE